MVVDSILPHAESGPNDHRKDAPRLVVVKMIMNVLQLVQQLLYHLIQKYILNLNRAILVVVIVVSNSKDSYFLSVSCTPLNECTC